MPTNRHAPAPGPHGGSAWLPRLGRALGLTALQLLVGLAVLVVSWIFAANAESEGPDDWAGLEYAIMGVLIAPAAAAVAGPIIAALMRQPLPWLYLLPVPSAVLAGTALANLQFSNTAIQFGVVLWLAGNLVIALATVRLPLRPGRSERRGIPF